MLLLVRGLCSQFVKSNLLFCQHPELFGYFHETLLDNNSFGYNIVPKVHLVTIDGYLELLCLPHHLEAFLGLPLYFGGVPTKLGLQATTQMPPSFSSFSLCSLPSPHDLSIPLSPQFTNEIYSIPFSQGDPCVSLIEPS